MPRLVPVTMAVRPLGRWPSPPARGPAADL